MKTSKRQAIVWLLVLGILVIAALSAVAQGQQKWVEYGNYRVFGEGIGGPKAYYPSIIYDPTAAVPYKMWYGTSGGKTGLAVSSDGIAWSDLGVVMSDGYHATVKLFPDGFSGINTGSDPSDGTMHYRMWYWDYPDLYNVQAIGYAESPDGKIWHNYQPLQNGAVPIVSGTWPDWNRGSYGPNDVLYNPAASNTGTDWKYILYYDGTTGGTESIGMGFSSDGVTWTGLDVDGNDKADPVLSGTYVPGDWDYDFVSRATIIKRADGSYEMWYSGGDGAVNHGIGYAVSFDGKEWVRDVDNPLFSKDDGVAWRNVRTYCPMVLFDPAEGIYKMWFTGKDDLGNYSIGYAVGGPTPTETWVDGAWDGMLAALRAEHGKYIGYNAFATIQGGVDTAEGNSSHVVHVNAGTYNAPTSIDGAVSIVGSGDSSASTTLKGDVTINSNTVFIGLPLQGLRLDGNVAVGHGVDASSSHINWCDIYGTVSNGGTGTFNARYNYWGTQDEAVVDGRTIGDIDYMPFLPEDANQSYADIQEILNAGIAADIDSAIEQLWQMSRLGQDASTFIGYQNIGGAAALRSIAPGDRIVLGGAAGGGGAVETTLASEYKAGDIIDGQLTVIDLQTNEQITNAAVTISLLGPDGSSAIALWDYAYYDETAGMYLFSIDTKGLSQGSYELIFQTDTGDSEEMSINIQSP